MPSPPPKPSLDARTALALVGTAIAVPAWLGVGWIAYQEATREGGIVRLFDAQPVESSQL